MVGAVVETVSVAVAGLTPVMLAGLVEPKLRVGRSTAPVGLVAMAVVSVTLPVKPPPGVNVMVEVLAVVAPGETETAVPTMVRLGASVTVTVSALAPARNLESPLYEAVRVSVPTASEFAGMVKKMFPLDNWIGPEL